MADVKTGWTQLELLNFPDEVSLPEDSSEDLTSFLPIQALGKKRTLRKNYPKYLRERLISSLKVWDNYFLGASNEEAFKVSKSILEGPGSAYPYVFFYSGPGLGKTHLLHALGKEILKKHKSYRLYFTSGRELLSRYRAIMREHGLNYFLEETSDEVDGLFIDDIEPCFECPDFQRDFCLIFNNLKLKGKQLVMTGCESPESLTGLSQKLFERLNSGLFTLLEDFDEGISRAFAQTFLKEHSLEAELDVIEDLVAKHGQNGYRLEGALCRYKFDVGPKIEEAPIAENNEEEAPKVIIDSSCFEEDILGKVSNYFGILKGDLLSHSRKKEFSLPRHIAMYFLHSVKGVSLTKLGKMFGRDHTSILYAAEKIKSLIERNDPQIKFHLESIKSRLT